MESGTLIENCTLIDGTGEPPREHMSVLVVGNRIESIHEFDQTSRTPPPSDDVTVIDGSGKWVMPGLIDAHCHLGFGQMSTGEASTLYTSVELRTLRSAWNAKRILAAGVTGLSQPGGDYYVGVGIRDAMREGIAYGPRMTTAGRFITTSNGIGGSGLEGQDACFILANTQNAMLEEVRRQVSNGVDLIKLADSPFGDYQAFTNDEIKAVADLVHQLKKKITIHARGSDEVSASVDAGLDWIMHGNSMTDEVIEKLATSQIPLAPVLLLLANFADFGHLVGTPVEVREGCRRMLEVTADTLHRAHAAGVKMIVGTDSGFSVTPYGEWPARELELLMTYAGLSSLEAIRAATKDAAVVLGLDGEVGEIAPGKLADILVLTADPVSDIRVLQDQRNLVVVMKDGEIVGLSEEERRIHPYDSSEIYSYRDLTFDLVRDGVESLEEPTAPDKSERGEMFEEEQAREILSDVSNRMRSLPTH